MKTRLFLLMLALLPLSPSAFAQAPLGASLGAYCTAGLYADGYIDFSGLPPAPYINPVSGQSAPSAAVTATLPVVGVPGLTVAVTIPPIYSNLGLQKVPAYSVDGGSLLINGLPNVTGSGSQVALTLNFSAPIKGLGANGEWSGHDGTVYTLQVGGVFTVTANDITNDIFGPQAQTLQATGTNRTAFDVANIQFNGPTYNAFTLSNFRVQSTTAPNLASTIPVSGLEEWLRADTSALPDANPTGNWLDQSGNGRNATPSSSGPVLTVDGRYCQSAFQFTGNQYFSFNLPIAGWDEMTVFLVGKAGNDGGSYASDAALLWSQGTPWGDTFVSPYQTHVFARFGTTQAGNNLYYSRPGTIGQDFTTTRAVHNHGTDSLYVNGVQVQNREGKISALAGVSGAATIGQGFHGEVSELLIYNRVLSPDETTLVETYLAQKYGTQ